MSRDLHKSKTVYIPYMCDHCYVLASALRAHGIPAEALPPPDGETLAIGLDLCRGRECLPCFTTTGDIIRRAQQPDFEPAQAAILMPTAPGPCRFGQYTALQRNLLEQKGLAAVEFISPNSNNSYQGMGNNPAKLRALAWQGLVAVDLLQKLLYQYRPYEISRGQADEIYQQSLSRIVTATEAGGGKRMVKALRWTARQFEALPVDHSEPRPVIGIVGEIYLRLNAYSNQDIVRQVENAGGEVMVASLMEWLYYTNWLAKEFAWNMGMVLNFLGIAVVDKYQRYQENKLSQPVAHLLKHPHEPAIGEMLDQICPYYEPYLATEAVLSMGKAVELGRNGVCGLLNVMPFSCMPGLITAGMAPRLRADLDHIPWLDVIYDAQEGTNLNTRLEAFMYQAIQFQRRHAPKVG
jgi:predicted nucleotide-binding protein (sugar kinase/HSP70/actin superfamily)